MNEYYYSENGQRIGPKTEEQMRALVANDGLSCTTLCWAADFGSDWKPIGETSLWSVTPAGAGPPPLPPQAVGDFYAYLFAAIPFLGAIVEAFASENSPDPKTIGTFRFIWLYLIAYAIVAGLDSRVIRRSGNQAVPPTRWFWLAPVYLWVRARQLGQRKTYFWAWVVCFILAIAIDQPEVKGAIYLGSGLPYCKSAFAIDHVSHIFADIPLVKNDGATAIEIKDIQDRGIVNGQRACQANVLTSLDNTVRIRYEIEPRESDYYLRVNIEP